MLENFYAYRLMVSVTPADLEYYTGWLNEMAAKGLYFVKAQGELVTFERDTPAQVRYHLEPNSPFSHPEREEDYREQGWKCLGPVGRDFTLYLSKNPDAPPFHTDPVAQSYTLDRLIKIWTFWFLLLIVMIAAEIFRDLWRYHFYHFTLFDPLILCSAGYSLFKVLRLRKRLRMGIPPSDGTDWRRASLGRRLLLLAWLAYLVYLAVSLWL